MQNDVPTFCHSRVVRVPGSVKHVLFLLLSDQGAFPAIMVGCVLFVKKRASDCALFWAHSERWMRRRTGLFAAE